MCQGLCVLGDLAVQAIQLGQPLQMCQQSTDLGVRDSLRSGMLPARANSTALWTLVVGLCALIKQMPN